MSKGKKKVGKKGLLKVKGGSSPPGGSPAGAPGGSGML